MIRKGVVILLLTISLLENYSQQQGLYSQYLYSMMSFNPARVGAKDYNEVFLSNRSQWVGWDGAPTTQMISFGAPIRRIHSGLGLNVVNESIGSFRTTAFFGNYAYHIKSKSETLSFGLRTGVYNYRIAKNQLNYEVENDPSSLMNNGAIWIPSFDFGINYKRKIFSAGLIINNLQGSFGSNQSTLYFDLTTHYFGYVSAYLKLSENWFLRASTMAKYTQAAKLNFDINGSLIYDRRIHVGASYRTNGEAIVHIEWMLSKYMRIGYAYDYFFRYAGTTTGLGSHEIIFGIEFGDEERYLKTPRFL